MFTPPLLPARPGQDLILANAILTFEDRPQWIGDVHHYVPAGPRTNEEMARVEIAFLAEALRQSGQPVDRLVKISLCYCSDAGAGEDYDRLIDYLCRDRAKYYFQPDQRGEVETELLNLFGAGRETRPFEMA